MLRAIDGFANFGIRLVNPVEVSLWTMTALMLCWRSAIRRASISDGRRAPAPITGEVDLQLELSRRPSKAIAKWPVSAIRTLSPAIAY